MLLMTARIFGLFLSVPVLSDRSIPQMIKLVLALWIGLLLGMATPMPSDIPQIPLVFVIALVNELFVGFLTGFICRIIFVGIEMAGAMMDMQMGLSVAATFDPANGGQVTIMERIMFTLATFLVLATNTHHLFLVSIYESFKVIPVAHFVEYQGILQQLGSLASKLFMTALDLSIPLLIIIFLLDFSLGLLARLAPQVNVFFLGFQIKPMLGLWIFVFIIPVLANDISNIFNETMVEIYKFFSNVKV